MKFSNLILLPFLVFAANVLADPPDTVPAPARDVTVVNTPLPVTGELEADVTIVNDESSPVPIIGTVEGEVLVINDESSPVPISGTVELSGTPEVMVVDGKQPFQADLLCNGTSCGDVTIYVPPEGQVCVIEYYSCLAYAIDPGPGGVSLVCQISTRIGVEWAQHTMNQAPFTTVPSVLSAGGMMKLYAESPAAVLVDAYLTGDGYSNVSQFQVSISGYCVDE